VVVVSVRRERGEALGAGGVELVQARGTWSGA
jgi:hypothetical protein